MKKYLLLFMALGLLAPKAAAFTSQQFAAKKMWQTLRMDPMYNGGDNVPTIIEGNKAVSASSNSPNPLIMDNFMAESGISELLDAYFYATISGNTATMTANNFESMFNTDGTTSNRANCRILKVTAVKNSGGYWYFIAGISNSNGYIGNQLQGTCTTLSDGNYKISYPRFRIYKCQAVTGNVNQYEYDGSYNGVASNRSYYKIIQEWRFGGMTFQTYDENATVTDTKYNYNGSSKTNATNRSYGANVQQVSNTQITIENFGNMGNPFHIYSDKNSNLNSTEEKYEVLYDLGEEDVIAMLPRDIMGQTDGNSLLWRNIGGQYYGNDTYSPIMGQIVSSNPVAHVGSNGWINNTTSRTELGNVVLKFDDYVIVDDPSAANTNASAKYVNYIANTTIKLGTPLDISHGAKLKKNEFGYGRISSDDDSKYIYLNCEITDRVNSKYVESYDLYIVPGNLTSPNYNSSDFLSEQGHAQATLIDVEKYSHGFNPSESDRQGIRALSEDDEQEDNALITNYNLLIPEDDLNAKSNNGNYSIYLCAHYTEDSGLQPTFHALTALGDTTTGVESVILDNNDKDEDAPAVYYNLNGVRMNGDALTPGIYIRRQGSTTSKVVIR